MQYSLEELSQQDKAFFTNYLESQKQKYKSQGMIWNLSYTKRVKVPDFGECNGFFDNEFKIEDGSKVPCLAVATEKPFAEWIQTFVHETSHADQWLENSSYWIKNEDFDVLYQWLDGKEYPQEQVQNVLYKIVLLEADCEKRSLEKIKKNNLPIDTVDYARKANAYLLFHHWMLKNRLWYNRAPYEVHEIVQKMPSVMMTNIMDYINTPDDNTMALFEACR